MGGGIAFSFYLPLLTITAGDATPAAAAARGTNGNQPIAVIGERSGLSGMPLAPSIGRRKEGKEPEHSRR